MKITLFRADTGDCLLVSGAPSAADAGDGGNVLVDGGMGFAYAAHVAPELHRMRREGHKIDLVIVSHVDEDHIGGVLRMLDDEVEWRVHDHQKRTGHPAAREPGVPRPPEIGGIWHNAFHEQVGKNSGPISDLLGASAAMLSGVEAAHLMPIAAERRALATSTGQAIQLSRRIGERQMNIPRNREFAEKLVMVKDAMPPPTVVGSMTLTVIGPFEEDLDLFAAEWNKWLKSEREQLEKIRRRARRDEERLATSEVDRIARLTRAQGEELARFELTRAGISEELLVAGNGIAAEKVLGRRAKVTLPNLVSVMVLVEEGKKSALLTGDGHRDEILRGLERHGKLKGGTAKEGGSLHVNVLKVQHHASEHNIDLDFARRITADDYIFCANGKHENPDLDVLRAIYDARQGPNDGTRTTTVNVTRRFRWWFSSHPSVVESPTANRHMQRVKKLVEELERSSKGRLRATFLEEDMRRIPV